MKTLRTINSKQKSKLLKRPRRTWIMASIAVLAVGTFSLLAAGGYVPGIGKVAFAEPTYQICNATPQMLCMNRKGGSYANGAVIIGWTFGDNNNNFGMVPLTGDICNHGKVSRAIQCPFSESTLNSRYDGKQILVLRESNVSDAECIGLGLDNSPVAGLTRCPDNNGYGGGIGVLFVGSQYPNMPTYLVNVHASNDPNGGGGYSPRFICLRYKGGGAYLYNPGDAGVCQFRWISNYPFQ
jgi:hypothetical protein